MVGDESQRYRLDFSSRLRTEDTEGTCIGTAPKCVNCSRLHPTGACNSSRACGCEARHLEERGLHYVADASYHRILTEIAGSEVLGGTQLKRGSTPWGSVIVANLVVVAEGQQVEDSRLALGNTPYFGFATAFQRLVAVT